jgi:acetyl-CoA synthetase
MDSEDPLFILYTSGTTGKPKGVIHTHGGFSVFAGYQAAFLIDLHENDVLLWPADIGWITGLVWNVYGLLIMGGSAIIYDGALNYPNFERIWDMLHQHNATIFGISPTAVRLFKKNNIEPLKLHSFEKIKNIPTTGEPLDEDSWWWLFEKVGNKKIPIMNLSGGTEIGGAMLSVFPGMKLKPSTV